MPLTETEESTLRLMLAEWQAGKQQQAQQLIDQKQTAEGQLRGLLYDQVLSAEAAATVADALKAADLVALKG